MQQLIDSGMFPPFLYETSQSELHTLDLFRSPFTSATHLKLQQMVVINCKQSLKQIIKPIEGCVFIETLVPFTFLNAIFRIYTRRSCCDLLLWADKLLVFFFQALQSVLNIKVVSLHLVVGSRWKDACYQLEVIAVLVHQLEQQGGFFFSPAGYCSYHDYREVETGTKVYTMRICVRIYSLDLQINFGVSLNLRDKFYILIKIISGICAVFVTAVTYLPDSSILNLKII
ncbi:Hypothetical_protein [Hexamita inflata]|uniref:Hypothetical_protein n=1 Tax=Hexamita inflata TaxID=28002 RepID=A0AA86R0U9_9EUKA|nr:Hypothetical protein HINF_LOCUS55835 [Hexamita inflata]